MAGRITISAINATMTGGTLNFPPFLRGPKEDNIKMEKPKERVMVV